MIDPKMSDALSGQLVFELYSSYIYLAIAARLETLKFPGAAHWMKMQADEELIHANIFYTYINNRDGTVKLDAIPQPDVQINSVLEGFELAYKHEQTVTSRINALAMQAMTLNDFASLNLLQFFIKEQVQEERSTSQVVDRLKLAGEKPETLLYLDTELAARPVPVAPASPIA